MKEETDKDAQTLKLSEVVKEYLKNNNQKPLSFYFTNPYAQNINENVEITEDAEFEIVQPKMIEQQLKTL